MTLTPSPIRVGALQGITEAAEVVAGVGLGPQSAPTAAAQPTGSIFLSLPSSTFSSMWNSTLRSSYGDNGIGCLAFATTPGFF